MLTPDVRFEGFTTEDWARFLQLWKPRASVEHEPSRPRGGVIVIYEGSRIRKAIHTKTGRISPSIPWPQDLGELARAHHASWALAAHRGALEEVSERFGARARRHDDLTGQALLLVQIVREMMTEGAIETWPRRLRGLVPPSEAMTVRALDTICGDGRALCLGVFKQGELWTGVVARRRGALFDLIAGPDELRPDMGLLAGDYRRDYRHFARAAEERYAPLAFGLFAEVSTFLALALDSTPGAWSRAIAVRDVILSPMPLGVGLALGVDGARYVLEQVKALTDRLDPTGFAHPILSRVQKGVGVASARQDLASVLGFNPLEALRALLRR